MNFVGCVGKLMEGIGLNILMASVFSGGEKVLVNR